MCLHDRNRRYANDMGVATLARVEKGQRAHRTPDYKRQKGDRWPFQAAFNTIVRQEMVRRGIFDAGASFGAPLKEAEIPF